MGAANPMYFRNLILYLQHWFVAFNLANRRLQIAVFAVICNQGYCVSFGALKKDNRFNFFIVIVIKNKNVSPVRKKNA